LYASTQVDQLNLSYILQTLRTRTPREMPSPYTTLFRSSYTFTNTSGSTQCVTIDTNSACTGVRFIFTAAYLGSFDPNNICTNWIGDSGSSPDPDQAFQVEVPDGQTLRSEERRVGKECSCPGYTLA